MQCDAGAMIHLIGGSDLEHTQQQGTQLLAHWVHECLREDGLEPRGNINGMSLANAVCNRSRSQVAAIAAIVGDGLNGSGVRLE